MTIKKFLIISYIILSTTFTHAADRWTGPTSPTSPMWGLTGSSIMAEALRENPQSQYNNQNAYDDILNGSKQDQIDKLQKEVNRLKGERGEW